MFTFVFKLQILSICLLLIPDLAKSFTLTFPTSNWVTCKPNVLQWTYDDKDADIFSVALFNQNRTKVNGNYQIANSLPTKNGSAVVRPNCVDPGSGYYLSFVNASKYAENQPQVYYTSPTFSILAASETVPTPDGTKLINNGTTLVNSDGSTVQAADGSTNSQTNNTDASGTLFKPAVAATPLSGTSTTSASGVSTTNSTNNAPNTKILRVPTLTITILLIWVLAFYL